LAVFIRINVKRSRRITVRVWRKAMKAAFQLVAVTWLNTMLPRRFAPPGYSAPWIKRRTQKYLRRKQGLIEAGAEGIEAVNRYQHNVLTGGMRDWMLSTAQIRSYPTRATVTFSKGLKPIYVRANPLKGPDMFREVTRLSQAEQVQLRQLVRKTAFEHMERETAATNAKKAAAARRRAVRKIANRKLARHRRDVRKSIADQIRAHLRNAA
jgi:hypothetical protein